MSPLNVSARSSFARLTGLAILAGCALLPSSLSAQGCVIARGGGGGAFCTGDSIMLDDHHPQRWSLNVAHRWFKSDRHFVGRDEQEQRKQQGTQVINNSHFLDVDIAYAMSERLSFNVTVPFVSHNRSSLYEHLGNNSGQRFATQSHGLGDVRASASYWMLNPENNRRMNFALGMGIKLPTGDYKATDIFNRPNGPTRRFVDSSIQPGDGGWGVSLDYQGFMRFGQQWTGYANASYLINPRERIAATNFSVPDTYLVRIGMDYAIPQVKGLNVSLGWRWEGVPSTDLIGGNEGSRRPGYAMSIEPGFRYATERFAINLSVPIAYERNRVRTYGASRVGDAAFADYTINTSISLRL